MFSSAFAARTQTPHRLRRGRAWRSALLWLLFLAALSGVLYGANMWYQIRSDNKVISGLAQGYDIEVPVDARAEVAFSRLNFLVFRDRLDESLPWAELLAQWDGHERPTIDINRPRLNAAPPSIAARALYNMGNGRLRHAFEMLEKSRLDKAPQSVRLAKDYYTRALRLAPQYWEARYNLDVASRLVRNLPRAAIDEDDEEPPETPKELWTQLPGLPRGLP